MGSGGWSSGCELWSHTPRSAPHRLCDLSVCLRLSVTQFPQRKWVSCRAHCSGDLKKLTSAECSAEFLGPRKQSSGQATVTFTLSSDFLVCQRETVTDISEWPWGGSSAFGRHQSGASLRLRLPPGPGPSVSQPHISRCHPRVGLVPSQATGGRAGKAQVQPCRGCGGGPAVSSPGSASPAAGWPGCA